MEGKVDRCGGIRCENVQGGVVGCAATSHTPLQHSRPVGSTVLDDGQQPSCCRGCCSISAPVRRVNRYLASYEQVSSSWMDHNNIPSASCSLFGRPVHKLDSEIENDCLCEIDGYRIVPRRCRWLAIAGIVAGFTSFFGRCQQRMHRSLCATPESVSTHTSASIAQHGAPIGVERAV